MLSVRQILCVAVMCSLGFLLPGCGPSYPDTIPVTGTVTLAGRPVAGAAVVFTPDEGKQATATTDSSGRFELSTFRLADGALPGRHRVSVAKTMVEPDDAEKVVFLIPRKYGNPDTSELTCEVQPEMGPIQFDLFPEPEPEAAAPAAETVDLPEGAETTPAVAPKE